MQPNAFRSWCRENDKIVLNLKTPQEDAGLLLPMEIPQTIEGGDSFFLYAKRYHDLYEILFGKKDKSTAIQFVTDLSKAISNNYLRMSFEAATLLYYDKFGEKRLIEVATCIELIISEKRFALNDSGNRASPIRIEGVLSDVKNKNVIPIILNSTISSHVISQLKDKIKTERRIYRSSPTVKDYWTEINRFYLWNKSKIKNLQLSEIVNVIYNSESKGEIKE